MIAELASKNIPAIIKIKFVMIKNTRGDVVILQTKADTVAGIFIMVTAQESILAAATTANTIAADFAPLSKTFGTSFRGNVR